jgi:peptide/nickel transport system substrate-binding protein
MNKRSGIFTFFLFLFLSAMILLQVLSMVQSDRLYGRLNHLLEILSSTNISRVAQHNTTGNSPENEGDWLIYHLSGEPRTLNPLSVDSDMSARYIYQLNIIEPLFYYDLDYDGVKLKPVLAESMTTSENGLEITIKLKKDIWFSDGVPVTADDVIFSYKTIMDPNVDAEDQRGYYANITDVIKVDNRTVKFVMSEAFWQTVESIGVFLVLPKHVYQYKDASEFNKRISNPVGSGPYVFEKWNVGQQVVLRKNDNYWDKKPSIEKIVFKFITNNTAALQALRSNDIDYYEPSSEQFKAMSENIEFKEKYHILSYWDPSFGFSYIGWNEAKEYFKDKKVRIALTSAFNRESVAKNIGMGYSKVISGPFYLNGKQNDPNIKPWPYDPEYAKKLLDETRWIDSDGDGIREKNGMKFQFKLSYPSGSETYERIVKTFKDDLIKVGINVITDPVEWSIFLDRMHKKDIDAAISGWGGTIESDPYQLFHSSQIDGGSNYFGFSNQEADQLIEKARRTLDPDKRYELYHQLHKLFHEEQPYTFLTSRPLFVFIDKRFENVKVHTLGINTLEWYVPKDKQRYK